MATPTRLNMGWSSVTVTPQGGSAITVDEVIDVQFERGASVKQFYGDVGKFSRVAVSREFQRGCRITSGDVGRLATIPQDTPCTIVAVLDDARNGSGAGAITSTLINAVLASNPYTGRVNEFSTGTLSFTAFSTDGTTDPLTVVQAPGP